VRVSSFVSGFHRPSHTAVLTDKGTVYSFGSNECGQLGEHNNSLKSNDIHTPNLDKKHITQIACGYFHCLSLSIDGVVFSWGYNSDGELGLKDIDTHVPSPLPIQLSFLKEEEKVVHIGAGAWHSCLTTNQGRLFTFGLGDAYRLGHETTENVRFPKEVIFPDNVFVKNADCGGAHTIAIVEVKE